MNPMQHFPVVIVGAGPTGLALANLLGVYGVQTLLIERHAATVGEPRAVSIDDESLRTVQNLGAISQVLPNIVQGYGVHYYSHTGRVFARIEPTSREYGYPKRSAFRQPLLESQLFEALARFAAVETRMSCELKSLAADESRVVLQVEQAGAASAISCDWLVGCDGGRSTVRELLGIPLRGETFAERWLIVDLKDRTTPFRHTRTYCDPLRPTIRLPGPHGSVRYEFMLHQHERADDVLDEGLIRNWMRQREPADADLPIVRKVVYTFHARMAQRWRAGRVLLAGDAAHLTPPFAGQGMNSGVRDAFNLAWKLAQVTHGRLGPALLDSYEIERPPHAWSLIRMALRIGRFMQPRSVLSATLMQGLLRVIGLYRPARDYVLQLKFKPKPRFAAGFFVANKGAGRASIRAGQLFIQPEVELPGGSRVLLDQVLGPGFAGLVWHGTPEAASLQAALPAELAVRRVLLVRNENDFPAPGSVPAGTAIVRDCDGSIERAMQAARATALLLRPDRYVLAWLNPADSARTVARLKQLVEATWTGFVRPVEARKPAAQ